MDGALLFVTAFDIFSIDPSTCRENWRTHEDYVPATPQEVNRGAAYLDGMLFRGTQDARVLAYDVKTGKRIWATAIGDPKKGESAPAAPIAWNGLVFIGNAGGDIKGVKGRMYALDAKTGKIVREWYLVPKAEGDPTRGPLGASPLNASTWGNSLQGVPITGGATWNSYSFDPETGLLYVPGGKPAPDFATGVREGSNLYSGSVVVLDAMTGLTRTTSRSCRKTGTIGTFPALQPLSTPRAARRFCRSPGGRPPLRLRSRYQRLALQAAGHPDGERRRAVCGRQAHPPLSCSVCGAEWNGPAYDPQLNLVFIGEVGWYTTVTLMPAEKIAATAPGKPWSGEASINPFNTWGTPDPTFDWASWMYAVNADTGAWRWRAKTNYPLQAA